MERQGDATSQITDGHVYVNGKFLGIYELPATIPVLDEGRCLISIFPGIKENGQEANRRSMRLFTEYETYVNLKPGLMDTVSPEATYRSQIHFDWIEDYENQNYTSVYSGGSNSKDSLIIIDRTHPDALQSEHSQYSLKVRMEPSEEEVKFEHSSPEWFVVPRQGQDVYLELDYKTNIPLQMGIYADRKDLGYIEQVPFIILRPVPRWNKIYLNLAIETSYLPDNTPIKIFFGTVNSGKNPTFAPQFFLDNIKLCYLK